LRNCGSSIRTRLTEAQQVSANLVGWQLDDVIREEPYLDYNYPIQQMGGANVQLVESLTVRYPVLTERNAENYLVVLAQVAARLDEATAEARRLAGKTIVPPRFILQATVKQMQSFVDSSPAHNPFVTAYAEKLAAMKSIPDERREAFRAEAEKIVAAQIYPAWKRGAALLQLRWPLASERRRRGLRLLSAPLHDHESDAGSDPPDRPRSCRDHRSTDG
jgi:uncharacterized protein (DUF885 family)